MPTCARVAPRVPCRTWLNFLKFTYIKMRKQIWCVSHYSFAGMIIFRSEFPNFYHPCGCHLSPLLLLHARACGHGKQVGAVRVESGLLFDNGRRAPMGAPWAFHHTHGGNYLTQTSSQAQSVTVTSDSDDSRSGKPLMASRDFHDRLLCAFRGRQCNGDKCASP